ncbi:uncharacterized protein CLUP02_03501 [Colletotrichum lupini]|uniref:Uncharacterized protein n=1 Tax=Colletotrichum lupini TaxID=145971 RepID=A0A9Q8SIJ3_9PEZI|nr:uncharacterized protein CLUP02_03501 [Colletotrichum lupini]UQC78027.1 hypothetical protein CLUP02_03501 [Colletotrichum lupini]
MTFVSVCPFCISLYLTLGESVIFPPSEDWEDSQVVSLPSLFSSFASCAKATRNETRPLWKKCKKAGGWWTSTRRIAEEMKADNDRGIPKECGRYCARGTPQSLFLGEALSAGLGILQVRNNFGGSIRGMGAMSLISAGHWSPSGQAQAGTWKALPDSVHSGSLHESPHLTIPVYPPFLALHFLLQSSGNVSVNSPFQIAGLQCGLGLRKYEPWNWNGTIWTKRSSAEPSPRVSLAPNHTHLIDLQAWMIVIFSLSGFLFPFRFNNSKFASSSINRSAELFTYRLRLPLGTSVQTKIWAPLQAKSNINPSPTFLRIEDLPLAAST